MSTNASGSYYTDDDGLSDVPMRAKTFEPPIAAGGSAGNGGGVNVGTRAPAQADATAGVMRAPTQPAALSEILSFPDAVVLEPSYSFGSMSDVHLSKWDMQELEYAALVRLMKIMGETPWEPLFKETSNVHRDGWAKRHQSALVALTCLAVVTLVGTTVFRSLEGWDTITSAYFTIVTVSTIGFGDVKPASAQGRIAVCFFAFFGLAMFGFVLMSLSAYSQAKMVAMLESLNSIESTDPYVAIPRVRRCRWLYALFGTAFVETTSYIEQTLSPRWYDEPWELPARQYGAMDVDMAASVKDEEAPVDGDVDATRDEPVAGATTKGATTGTVPNAPPAAAGNATTAATAKSAAAAAAAPAAANAAPATAAGADAATGAPNADEPHAHHEHTHPEHAAARGGLLGHFLAAERVVPVEIWDHDNMADDLLGTVDISVDDFPLRATMAVRKYNIEYPPDEAHSNDPPSALVVEMRRDLDTLYLRVIGCDNLPIMDRNSTLASSCSDSAKQVLIALGVLFVVIGLGAVFFHLQEGMRFINAVYMCAIASTTIGYGDFFPTTTNGKAFFLGWIFAGLGAAGYLISIVQEKTMSAATKGMMDTEGNRKVSNLRYTVMLFAKLSVMVVILLTVLTVVMKLLERWTFFEAFYFSVVTLTTVGYGDLLPSSDVAKIVVTVFSFIGLGALSAFNSILSQIAVKDAESDETVLRERNKSLRNSSCLWRFYNSITFQILIALVALVVLTAILAVVLHHTERKAAFYTCSETNCTAPLGINRIDAGYLASISIATVGYGDFAPRSVSGRSTFMLFIFAALLVVSHSLYLIQKASVELIRSKVGSGKKAGLSQGTPAQVRSKMEHDHFVNLVSTRMEEMFKPPPPVPRLDVGTDSASTGYSSSEVDRICDSM